LFVSPQEAEAHGKILEGVIALEQKDARQAVKVLTEATTLLDIWVGRLDLGRAYLAAGAFPQADSEFDPWPEAQRRGAVAVSRRGAHVGVPAAGLLPSGAGARGHEEHRLRRAVPHLPADSRRGRRDGLPLVGPCYTVTP